MTNVNSSDIGEFSFVVFNIKFKNGKYIQHVYQKVELKLVISDQVLLCK